MFGAELLIEALIDDGPLLPDTIMADVSGTVLGSEPRLEPAYGTEVAIALDIDIIGGFMAMVFLVSDA